MKKKSEIEADLDPKGNRTRRPGAKIADVAIALSKPTAARKRRGAAASAAKTRSTAAKAKRKPSR